MQLRSKMLLCVFTIMVTINTVSSIHCFQCNSANNSACIDIDVIEPEMRARIIPIINCDADVPAPVAGHFFCRKLFQTIFHPDRQSEVRVTRGCGWVRNDVDCYNANNADHLETVCQCFHDFCNSAHFTQPTVGAIVMLLMALICNSF